MSPTLLRHLSIIDALAMGFAGVILLFFLKAFSATPYWAVLLVITPLFVVFPLLAARLRARSVFSSVQKLIQFLYPIVFLFSIFESFFMILPYFNPRRYDQFLTDIDHALFGVHPTLWMQQWTLPWLTELMYIVYFLYFPMPLLPVIYLYRQRDWKTLERTLFIYLVCYFGGYIGYFLFPASGPRHYLSELQTVPLRGVFLSETIRQFIDFLEPNKLDVFPSLHASIVITTLLITYSVHRIMFNWFVPLAVAILISLIYCRYHYVIDILAGILWALASFWVSNVVYARYHKLFTPHF